MLSVLQKSYIVAPSSNSSVILTSVSPLARRGCPGLCRSASWGRINQHYRVWVYSKCNLFYLHTYPSPQTQIVVLWELETHFVSRIDSNQRPKQKVTSLTIHTTPSPWTIASTQKLPYQKQTITARLPKTEHFLTHQEKELGRLHETAPPNDACCNNIIYDTIWKPKTWNQFPTLFNKS